MTRAKKEIRKYRWRHHFKRNFILNGLIMIIPIIIIGSLCMFFVTNREAKQTENEARSMNNYVLNEYSSFFSGIDETYTVLYTNDTLNSFLLNMQNPVENIEESKKILSQMQSLCMTITECRNMYLYIPYADYVLATESSSYFKDFFDRSWYDEYLKNPYKTTVCSRNMEELLSIDNMLTVIKPIEQYNYIYGVLIFNIDMTELNERILAGFERPDEVYFYNKAGQVMISTNSGSIGKNIEQELKNSGKEKIIVNSNENNGFYTTTVSTDKYSKQHRLYIMTILLIMIAAVIGACVIAFLAANMQFKNIIEIIKTINNKSDAPVFSDDEYEFIMNNYIHLAAKSENIEQKLAEQVQNLNKMQLCVFQNQISPHFIFNTLNMIVLRDRILNKKSTEISRIVELMSEIMRWSLDVPNYVVSLDTELEYLTKYVELEDIRYYSDYKLVIDVSEELRNVRVLKFMLQPIIENAIKYGFAKKKIKDGVIKLTAYKYGGDLIIEVSNNGEKITAEKMAEIKNKMNNEEVSGNKIGLQNVNQRIKLAFGERYGIDISCDDEVTVKYTLPVED